ncbi:MAG: DNA polymerase III subunit alpha [Kiritimatiellae bacterium]|nr:DNA polymerase III subunit alpha [Kiritimatiellia bacterium]MDD4342379.1 DNA polymerase III subunit alpha [Kiritimatiellia bacterium]
MEPKFTHLHLHTEYSLLDGLCALDRGKDHHSPLMERARELGQVAMAITDHGNLYGAVHFYKAARKHGIKPVLGCEIYVTPGDHRERVLVNKRQANHLVLLAENDRGFANLIHLVSKAHLDGFYYKPRIDRALLAEHHEGLIGLSACLKGEVAEALADGLVDKARTLAGEYAEILGPDHFYLELQDHGMPEQQAVNRQMVQLAKELGLPLVATNDVHYLQAQHAVPHEMLLCLQTQAKWSETDRMKYGSDQFFLKSEAEMRRLFGELPEALDNTWRIAERCNVEMALEGQKNPHFPNYRCPEGLTHKQYLTQIAAEGVRRLYGVENLEQPRDEHEQVIAKRFSHELGVIEKTGFLNYFLVVWDFINAAKQMGIPVGPGRGSGAGSLVAYVTGITGIDPLRYDLIFERFLNPERVSPPDFDIDFCQARRGEVIEYVKRKYGADSVAQIVTYGTLGAKTLIRDIGRALEIPLPECDKLAKMVPEVPGTTLESAQRESVDFRDACLTSECAKQIMTFAPPLEDMPRQIGTHAAGVVIGERPLIEMIPLTKDKDGNIISQWEAGPLEESGLLKMDFLGLKTLTVVREACDNVKHSQGINLDPDAFPLDDPATYELLARGDTVGVFQVESEGMRDLLRQLQINKIEELIALIALYRPGPMKMIPDFIARKHGRQAIDYPHPLLEDILKETYGIMVYQEQVQQAAGVLAGFSMGQGDILRRAMGKKKPEEMAQQRKAFEDGCVQQKTCSALKARQIFDKIAEFASYGFNKSHSAAYGIVTFQTAYLKANHPGEFMAALLSSEIGNTDKLPVLVAEVQKMGIRVLPPDVNESGHRFTPVTGAIRYGLAGVKGVGGAAVTAMLREREANGPFKGLVDFCERIETGEVNKKAIEALVKCGAFDFTGIMRGQLFEGIETAMGYAASVRKDRAAGQASLFDMLGGEDVAGVVMTDADLPVGEPWPKKQMLAFEKELIGFYISGHPLLACAWTLEKYNQCDAVGFAALPERTRTRIGGLVVNAQKRYTKPKKQNELPREMMSFRLDTLEGSIAAVAFPEAYARYGIHLQPDAAVMLCGSVRKDNGGGSMSLAVDEIYPIDEVPMHFTRGVSLHVNVGTWTDERMRELKDVMRRHPGTMLVNICLLYPDNAKVYLRASNDLKVKMSEAFSNECTKIVDGIYVATLKEAGLRLPPEPRWKRRNGG